MYQFRQIPSEAQIHKYLRRIVYGKEIYCPVCKSRKVYKVQGRYRCRKCRIRFSLLSHTWLSNLKLPLQEFWLVLWCWTTQVPVKQTIKLTLLSEVTIRHWFEQFREHLPEDQEVLEHLVQLDEAYFGGKRGRALFLGKQVGSRKLAYQIISHASPTREHAWKFLHSYVSVDTVLNTDGASIYKEINAWWPVYHNRDIHKRFEFGHTAEIEGMFGVLRTFIRRMYHHVTVDKLPSVVGEFCCRFSHPEMFDSPYDYLLITLRLVPTR
jgi:transposase-like protein